MSYDSGDNNAKFYCSPSDSYIGTGDSFYRTLNGGRGLKAHSSAVVDITADAVVGLYVGNNLKDAGLSGGYRDDVTYVRLTNGTVATNTGFLVSTFSRYYGVGLPRIADSISINGEESEEDRGIVKLPLNTTEAITASTDDDTAVTKGYVKTVVDEVGNKLDKPVMTNNYYGLWDDTNKKFINGSIYKNGNFVYISDKLYTSAGINTKDLSFTLQSSITPTPNTLVPKTDGSGLLWYNNSSVGKELSKKTEVITITGNTTLSEVHNGAILHITNSVTLTYPISYLIKS